MKFLHRLFADVPLIEDTALSALIHDPLDVSAAEHPVFKRIKDSLKPVMEIRRDGIAIIPVEGALAYKPDFFEMIMGIEDSRNVLAMIEEAKESDKVDGILLNIDSPGGMVVGGFEIADAVLAADKAKPVIAWSGGWMTSLAYLIGSQASKVVSTRSAQLGSIGALMTFADYSKLFEARGVKVEVFTNKEAIFKAAGAVGTSLNDEQRAYFQSRVDLVFAQFRKQVLAKRPDIGPDAIKGQVFYGSEARKNGLVDAIGSMDSALSMLASEIRKRAQPLRSY